MKLHCCVRSWLAVIMISLLQNFQPWGLGLIRLYWDKGMHPKGNTICNSWSLINFNSDSICLGPFYLCKCRGMGIPFFFHAISQRLQPRCMLGVHQAQNDNSRTWTSFAGPENADVTLVFPPFSSVPGSLHILEKTWAFSSPRY